MSLPPELVELAHAYGIATDFTDWQGRPAEVGEDSVRAVLTAMRVDASDPAAALARREEEPWRRLLPRCLVVAQGASRRFPVHVPEGDAVTVDLALETGETRELAATGSAAPSRVVDGVALQALTYDLPDDLPLGYHTLRAVHGHEGGATTVVVTPSWLGLPDSLDGRRAWGLATQLYSVRSRESWGVGDLADLSELAAWSGGELGADYVLVNPLHEAEPVAPMEPSPYLPSTRRYVNPIYLRVEAVPEYAELPPQDRARVDALAQRVHDELDDVDVIDRDTAWTAKREALEIVHRVPRTPEREEDFRAYCEREGDTLSDVATWSAIAREHGSDARRWPGALRHSGSPDVAAYAASHAEAVDVERWLQWLLDEQLAQAQQRATAAGMALGTMHDLAVGVHPGGADVWRSPEAYATGIQVGAPPDPFNQVGQDWSQPPWLPEALAEVAYAPLRALTRNLLRHAGGIRIDHIIGLFRLWWIPEGRPPSEGTYVRYDHEAMVGVVALEAHRAGAVVVGEDLGVVEPSAREFLAARGVLGTSILWFERDDRGDPLPAERWREYCMASVTTHDLPPTAGYLDGAHVELRDRLGLLTRPVEEEAAADREERDSWLAEVRSRGLLPDELTEDDTQRTVEALHRYLTATPSRLLCVSLTDAVGDRRTQNQPGTTDEYPNWRVPLSGPDEHPLRLEDVVASERARALARAVDPG